MMMMVVVLATVTRPGLVITGFPPVGGSALTRLLFRSELSPPQ